jgi:hypothetical protein
VLGGIAVAPAVAIGGWVLGAQGEKAMTKAESYCAEVDQAIACIHALIAFHHRAEMRADELQRVLRALDARASARLDELFATLDSFDDQDEGDLQRLAMAMLLCKALSDLLGVRVLDDEGQLDKASAELIARHRYLLEGV